MFQEQTFPLQQGAMDSLCAIYSVLNAMNALGELRDCMTAKGIYDHVIPKIHLPFAVTKGSYPIDPDVGPIINWLSSIMSKRIIFSDVLCDVSQEQIFAEIIQSEHGGIIYINDGPGDLDTHYTFFKPARKDGALPLWDSRGLDLLELTRTGALVNGHAITITHLWKAELYDAGTGG